MKKLALILLITLSNITHAFGLEKYEAFTSKFVNDSPEFRVSLPANYEADKTKHYPVIYVLDGKLNDQLVSAMLQRLNASEGSNGHIIVGINSKDRLRDFTPTVNLDPRGPLGAGGGGDKFLDFLESELMPNINKKYRTANHNVIMGHSIAGLLVIHAFHARPTLFQGHLTFSPAVWWGARETLKAAQKHVLSGKDSENFLYMNIGSEGGEMRRVYDAFAHNMLRNRSIDLVLQLDEFDNEGHDFTLAAGLYNALTGLYRYQQSKSL